MTTLVTAAAIFKYSENGPLILTQERSVQDKTYDPFYDKTYECPQGRLESNETFLDALFREVKEETGMDIKDVHILGSGFLPVATSIFSTRNEDEYYAVQPLLLTQTMKGPQPWLAAGFAVEVPLDWKPDYCKADGAASKEKWWTPEDLIQEIENSPRSFMGLSAPLLLNVAMHLRS
jgi:8-oxo-dGTP pyrophosphatase MutT (NUDIX family)